MTEDETREQQEYEQALRRAEQARQERRNSLPNILRQTAFNRAQANPFGSIFGRGIGHLGQPTGADLMREAADEIDRLRAEIANLKAPKGIPL